jgi:hypothetical protein
MWSCCVCCARTGCVRVCVCVCVCVRHLCGPRLGGAHRCAAPSLKQRPSGRAALWCDACCVGWARTTQHSTPAPQRTPHTAHNTLHKIPHATRTNASIPFTTHNTQDTTHTTNSTHAYTHTPADTALTAGIFKPRPATESVESAMRVSVRRVMFVCLYFGKEMGAEMYTHRDTPHTRQLKHTTPHTTPNTHHTSQFTQDNSQTGGGIFRSRAM